ncbi:MAG: bifunctional [glutamate--ammonia ligase]-adenylyl-L-tyrosine phosphorylase/[glutamate--ammonia-ligase] adenylyltransferase [Desulfobacterales bacterium]|nr:bifunctional [glutamate--ammonia ligase]-adenylyl-L-tyrosine phosphorylase/[glutamate--ammonia-ligase] adenylyltransferase [Desulfobacterales bacterium]
MSKDSKLSDMLVNEANKRWDEFCNASENAGVSIIYPPEIISEIKRVFSFSDFVAKTCIRNPEMPDNLIRTGDLQKTYKQGDYYNKLETYISEFAENQAALQSSIQQILRRFRCREMVRIAWRDLAGHADLSETMADLSDLADSCIEHALSLLYRWECEKSGVPFGTDGSQQHLVVLGMGKLGAYELNFSSDIDLIFAYPEHGETKGAKSVTNEQFFSKLCRDMIKLLGANTPDGIVFRVDMGLRPFGEAGPLVMNFDNLETYYENQGREWERYAWIKARVAAGDKQAGKRLLARLNPFIYRRHLDFGVYDSLRDMKQKISLEVKRKGMEDNIKLGPGGIREIEFFGQIFQLTRGGISPVLQERRIQNVLKILVRENCIEQKECDELQAAYVFLRNTEHRLQEVSDKQTHKLPSDPLGKERLAASMGFDSPAELMSQLEKYMENVHCHFTNLLGTENDTKNCDTETESELKALWNDTTEAEHSKDILEYAGFGNPDDVIQLLNYLNDNLVSTKISREGRERIDRLVPLVIRQAGRSEQPVLCLTRIINLIIAVKTRTSYISLLLENPGALAHLIKLANTSSWILAYLTSHPATLDELLDPRSLYFPPKKPDLEREIHRRLEQIPVSDLEYRMDALRVFKQVNILRVAAADITNTIPLMRISDHLSYIAEVVLNEVVEMAWAHLVEKHGEPTCCIKDGVCEKGFAVIAYGKLGGIELGYASDLDLVFLHAGTEGETKGEWPIDNAQFFTRLGQRVVHILTAHTPAGTLYEADMRLRPSGSGGILVSHAESFREYQVKKAWTWEKQAIIRARAVSGDSSLADFFENIRKQVLTQSRNKAGLQKDVSTMRERMRKEHLDSTPGIFDLKQGRGGIVDIEFFIQYLVLLNSHEHPKLVRWTDNVRLIGTLAETGIIDYITAYILRKAYLIYRSMGHRLNLQEKPATVPENRFRRLRKKVKQIWELYLFH